MKKTLLGMFVLVAVSLAEAPTAAVAGKWAGQFSMAAPSHGGPEPPVDAVLVLQQNGAVLSGSAGVAAGPQLAITKGSVNGDKVTLEVQRTGMTIKFDLVLTGDRLAGEVNMTGGQGPSGKAMLDVTRTK